ncbi:hypothetical protein RvY_11068-3, partial [Ramazzottius varieornatus]
EDEAVVDQYLEEIACLSKDELDRRLGKFGVKPLPKAQAVAFLQYVYRVKGMKSPGKKRATKSKKKKTPRKNTPKKYTKAKKPRTAMEAKDQPDNAPSTSTAAVADLPSGHQEALPKQKRKSKGDDYKVKLLNSSSDDEREEAESITINTQDVMDIPVEELEEGSDSAPRPKVVLRRLRTAEEVDAFMMQYILDRPDLHERILQYETVYLKPLLKQLKEEEGVVPKADLLMDFFDAKTICFSQHNAEKPRQWGGSKDKKRRKR